MGTGEGWVVVVVVAGNLAGIVVTGENRLIWGPSNCRPLLLTGA